MAGAGASRNGSADLVIGSQGLIGRGGLCERKWSPGQPTFLNYALVAPLTKVRSLGKGVVLCDIGGRVNLGVIRAKTLGEKRC